jgi:2-hydroxycyclohexanecarboxyl-CoA dehydrogenase
VAEATEEGAVSLNGKVALVTGAGRGIGAAIAQALAGAGASVAVLDVDAETAVATATSLPTKSVGIQADITDSTQVRAAVGEAVDALGPVDVLVNNAGWDKIEPFLDNDESDWDRIIAINLKGPIVVTRAVLDSMIERGSGVVVNIASDAGRVGSSGEAVYSAAKGGVIAFTKTLAREMARHGIRVNCVCPGPTDTALLATMDDKLRAGLERAIPMRRIGQPADIAPVVVFLASDAAGYVTGQTLSVSGGLTMA